MSLQWKSRRCGRGRSSSSSLLSPSCGKARALPRPVFVLGILVGYNSGQAVLPTKPCEDAAGEPHCSSWAAKGECEKNPGFMHKRCPLSCHVCTVAGTPHLERMPIVGWGTCCRGTATGEPLKASMRDFLLLGGRLIDTAIAYGNQKEIGEVLKEPGL